MKKKAIIKGLGFLEAVRDIYPEMQMQTLVTLLTIAEADEAMPMKNLVDDIGISQAAISRNVAILSKHNRRVFQGKYQKLGLIEVMEDSNDIRRKLLKLSVKGEKFINKLTEILE